MGTLHIRDAEQSDAALIRDFVRELAIYEKEPEAAVISEEDVLRDGFGAEPYFRCLIAGWDGHAAGFALSFFQYSTREGRPALYLEDLFVRPEFRGRGIGKALLQHLARVALQRNCTRFQWECLDWNQPALDFYSAMGAKVMERWLNLRMNLDAIKALAE